MDIENKNTGYSDFLVLWRQNESAIFKFILMLAPKYSLAEEIMQETILTLWEKFSTFEKGSDFFAWARQIARYKTLSCLHKNKSRNVVSFGSRTLDVLAENVSSPGRNEAAMLDALHHCIDKLARQYKELVMLRYAKGLKIKRISELWNVSSKTLMRQLAKIHYSLQVCIEKTFGTSDV